MGFHQGAGPSTGRNTNLEVRELGDVEFKSARGFLERIHEGVVTAIARSLGFLHVALVRQGDFGHGRLALGDDHSVVLNAQHLFIGGLEHVGNDVGEILRGDDVLLVSEFDDSLQHQFAVGGGKLDAQPLKIVIQGCLAREFAQGIPSGSSKAAVFEAGVVEVALGIAVGVDSRGLSENITAGDRRIRGDLLAAEGLHHARESGQSTFVDIRAQARVIVKGGDYLGEGRVARAFSHGVDAGVDAPGSGLHSGQAVGRGEAVVVVAVEFEIDLGPGSCHQPDVASGVAGRENAQGVGQVDARHPEFAQMLHEGEDVVEGIAHPARPILEIDVDRQAFAPGIADSFFDSGSMLLGAEPELLPAVFLGSLGQEVQDFAPHIGDPVHRGLAVAEAQDFHALDHPGLAGPRGDGPGRFALAFGYPSRGDFDAIDLGYLKASAKRPGPSPPGPARLG